MVYEVGEAAFEGGGSRPRFFGGGGEFFVSASEVAERARREAAFGRRSLGWILEMVVDKLQCDRGSCVCARVH